MERHLNTKSDDVDFNLLLFKNLILFLQFRSIG